MKSTILALSLIIAAGVVFVGSAVSATANGATLIEQNCTRCHNTVRICKRIGHFSAAQWKATVGKMVTFGATLDAAGEQTVVDYLAHAKKADVPFCK